jgi:hypothetical protein
MVAVPRHPFERTLDSPDSLLYGEVTRPRSVYYRMERIQPPSTAIELPVM